ncbi:alpha/beta fold hydrolase [Oligoflexia bacterium]|nr:alpha/beta fold hydrolase [Oligoflexia bacterium]
MPDFVFLHGAFHGAWCWETLNEELKLRGVQGFACDLPGHGNDSTPRRQVTRDSYISKACDFIASLPVDSLTLVGHSLAGIILPEVAAEFPLKIKQVVYLAALILSPGEKAIDLIPANRRSSYYKLADNSDDYTVRINFEKVQELFFYDIEEQLAREYYAKLTPQPFQVYLDKAKSPKHNCPVSYIVCNQDRALTPELCLSWLNKIETAVYRVDSGHDVMLSNPSILADLLLKIAV